MDNEELLEFETLDFMVVEVDPITLQQVGNSPLVNAQMPAGVKYDTFQYKKRMYAVKEMRFDADLGASIMYVVDMQKAQEEYQKAQTKKRFDVKSPTRNRSRT